MTDEVTRVTDGGKASLRRRVNNAAIGTALVLSVVVLFPIGLDVVKVVLAAVVVIGLVTAWKDLNTIVRGSTIVSVGLGAVAIPLAGASLMDVALGFTQMAAIFAFFVFVRLLEVPILTGGFNRAVARTLSERLGVRHRATAGGMLTYGLATGLSVGSVPIGYRTLQALWNDDATSDAEGISKVVAHNFTSANAWTPISPIVALTLDSTAASLGDVFRWVLPLSLAMSVYAIRRQRGSGTITLARADAHPATRSTFEFVVVITVLVVSLVVIDAIWGVGPMGAAMISIVVTVALWQSRLTGRAAPRQLAVALDAQRPTWPEHFTLFCSGGLLVGAALAVARSADSAQPLVQDHVGLVLLIVPVGMAIAAIFGLYPFVSLAALGALLGPQILVGGGVAGLAVALIVGASVGFLISPFSGLTLLLSAMSGHSSFEIGLRWNREFGLLMILAGTAVAFVPFLLD